MSPVCQHFVNDNTTLITKELTILIGRHICNECKHRITFLEVKHKEETERGKYSK